VACKQWNDLPSDGGTFRKGGSYDNTGRLSGSTWRHVVDGERVLAMLTTRPSNP